MNMKYCVFIGLCFIVSVKGFTANDVVFHLFTRGNPSQSQILYPDWTSIITSNFGITSDTIFTIHTTGGSAADNFNAFVIPAFLVNGDYNVIAVDWREGAEFYTSGLSNAVTIGEVISAFIDVLRSNFAYDVNKVHLVGIGLGGHIAGIAARRVDGEVGRITALDPSFHGWTHNSEILTPESAGYVEVLHTNSGVNGYDYPLGDVDFYVNGGTFQLPCLGDNGCAHMYSYVYFAESLQAELDDEANKFVGTLCESYTNAIAHSCVSEETLVFGGGGQKSGSPGIYYFRTSAAQPFALG